MRLSFKIALFVIATTSLISCNRKSPDYIVACGWDEVFIADISQDVPQKVWSWTGDNSEGLPLNMRYKFLTTDECKPVDKAKKILITSSGGGVALVDRYTGNTLFHASVPNAHSAELLPESYLVVAASFSDAGNRLMLFNINQPGKLVSSDSLYGAHGLYYDKKSKLLWALGTEELKSYKFIVKNNTANLEELNTYILPERDGHDLVPTQNREHICLSTASGAWIFNTKREEFSPHPTLGNEARIKSISYNRHNKSIAYVKASDQNWWAYYIRFAESKKVVHFPGEKIYKARWLY